MNKLLICFDVDGTLIDDTIFIWQTLHDKIQTDPEERKFWADAYWSKIITYEQWARKDVEMWMKNGITRDCLLGYISDLHPMTGAHEAVMKLKNMGHLIGIISGSLDIALEAAFPDWKDMFGYIFLNRLIFSEDGKLSGVDPTPFDIEHKATGLKEMSKRAGIDLSNTVFVGDNFNDIEVAKIAGSAIAFNCKSEELARVSDHVVMQKDLRAVLPIIEKFADRELQVF
jgi:HAD superfamily phosphoserine phosphatase-like hydrolase